MSDNIDFRLRIIDESSKEVKKVSRITHNELGKMTKDQIKYTRAINKTEKQLIKLNKLYITGSRKRQTELKKEITLIYKRNQASKQSLRSSKGNGAGIGSGIGAAMGGGMGMLASSMGPAAIAYVSSRVTADFVKRGIEYEKSISHIRALLKGNEELTQSLAKNALNVGRMSIFTVKEVAGLEKVLLKFGFSAKEVLNSTQSIVTLAEATGISLEAASSVAAETLRGFGMDSTEMQRVVDVMGSSFVSSALDIDKYTNAMSYIAPIAKQAGFSIEEITAMLSVLANAGVKGTRAGTGLRRIIVDAATNAKETGKTIHAAYEDMARDGLTLADANDEVGRTAQTALSILSASADTIEYLTENYENVIGVTKELSDIMKDNLAGDIDKATSAYDAFVNSIWEGNSVISKSMRTVVQGFTSLLLTGEAGELAYDNLSLFGKAFYNATKYGSIWGLAMNSSSDTNIPESNQGKLDYYKELKRKSENWSDDAVRYDLIIKSLEKEIRRTETITSSWLNAGVSNPTTIAFEKQSAVYTKLTGKNPGLLWDINELNKEIDIITEKNRKQNELIKARKDYRKIVGDEPNKYWSTSDLNRRIMNKKIATEETRLGRGNAVKSDKSSVDYLSRRRVIKSLTINISKLIGVNELSTTNITESTNEVGNQIAKELQKIVVDVATLKQ